MQQTLNKMRAMGSLPKLCCSGCRLENGVKYVLVSHNTKMGAAKGAVLVAEHLVHCGYVRHVMGR